MLMQKAGNTKSAILVPMVVPTKGVTRDLVARMTGSAMKIQSISRRSAGGAIFPCARQH